jgi:hypothetical protein
MTGGDVPEFLATRVAPAVRVAHLGECWEWTGTRMPAGYGKLSLGGEFVYAHRLAYAIAHQVSHRDIPAGIVVRHRCDNPPCCNPSHLVLGTYADNTRDMVERGRSTARGSHCARGHEFDDANTYIDSRGKRRCRTCERHRNRARYVGQRQYQRRLP